MTPPALHPHPVQRWSVGERAAFTAWCGLVAEARHARELERLRHESRVLREQAADSAEALARVGGRLEAADARDAKRRELVVQRHLARTLVAWRAGSLRAAFSALRVAHEEARQVRQAGRQREEHAAERAALEARLVRMEETVTGLLAAQQAGAQVEAQRRRVQVAPLPLPLLCNGAVQQPTPLLLRMRFYSPVCNGVPVIRPCFCPSPLCRWSAG